MKLQKGRVSLDRALSKLGLCSRVEAGDLIRAGSVKVHGVVETNPERRVNPNTAHIVIDDLKAIKPTSLILVFHKPKGVLTTKRDPEGRKTIYDYLPRQYQSLHPVGRLDMQTSGLLLLTNDTKISSFMTEPANKVERVYLVTVQGNVGDDIAKNLMTGVNDLGERLKADQVKILKQSGKESLLELVLVAGKNREIRRLCLTLGYEVLKLKRIRYGKYELMDLKPCEHRLELI